MPFYEFNQNNSGGTFVVDETRGISHTVWIEAPDDATALRKAEDIGLYFEGVSQGIDCECCGDRWYSSNGPQVRPDHYGVPIRRTEGWVTDREYAAQSRWDWVRALGGVGKDDERFSERPLVFVHYADGGILGTAKGGYR